MNEVNKNNKTGNTENICCITSFILDKKLGDFSKKHSYFALFS